jgi:hypothetical protein
MMELVPQGLPDRRSGQSSWKQPTGQGAGKYQEGSVLFLARGKTEAQVRAKKEIRR